MIGHNSVQCCMKKFLRVQIGFFVNHHELILMERQTSQIKWSQLKDENLSDLVSSAGNFSDNLYKIYQNH